MDAWRERDETRRRSLFLLEAQTKKVGGWVRAVAPRDGRLVSCRVVGISLLWPGVECQSAAANGKLEGVFLVAPVRWREREKKIGRLLKLEVVVFTTASTAAQQEQEQKEKRSHTMGSFSLFPRDLISSSWPACHPCSSRPMAPWTLVLRGPLSRACLPKLVCLSTQACFCSRDCGPELASLQSHTRDKPTRASFRMVGSAGVAGKARGWLAAVGSHPEPPSSPFLSSSFSGPWWAPAADLQAGRILYGRPCSPVSRSIQPFVSWCGEQNSMGGLAPFSHLAAPRIGYPSMGE